MDGLEKNKHANKSEKVAVVGAKDRAANKITAKSAFRATNDIIHEFALKTFL